MGRGLLKRPGDPVPNVEAKTGGRGAAPVAGFGAVASYWAPRNAYAGTYDGAWIEKRKPLLPADFDPRFFHFAPIDQQFDRSLRGGEPVELVNLTPQGRVVFELPKRFFTCSTHFGRRRTKDQRAHLETVLIEPTEARLIMVYKAEFHCHDDFDDIDITHVVEKELAEL